MNVGQITYRGRPVLAMEPERKRCPECHGRGWTVHSIIERDGSEWPVTSTCDMCRGNGWLWRDGTAGPRKQKVAQS